jgi:hypothetical protein
MKFRKRLLIPAVLFMGTVLVTGGGCGFSAFRVAKGVMNGTLRFSDLSFKTLKWCAGGMPFTDKLEEILNGKYIVLLQNNTELRPTGGFMGSYVKINFMKGALTGYAVEDIYQPDGQLPGHVEPPYPIQESFKQGWWKLRDSNWDPDFASAAPTVKWFMEQGGEENISGMAAVNLNFLQQWLKTVNGVTVDVYGQKVTDKNLYSQAQTYAETRTEGNNTQKREFLGAVGEALVNRTRKASFWEMVKLSKLIIEELNNKQILLWSDYPEVQKDIADRKWDGGLVTGWDGEGDYIYDVDANLGSNKANCCIDRKITEEITRNGNSLKEEITIRWFNNNEFSAAKPPVFWGGDNINYARVIVPKAQVNIVGVHVNGQELRMATPTDFADPASLRQNRSEGIYTVEDRGDLQIVGFWAINPAQKETKAEIDLESGRNNPGEFKVRLKRQPGVESFDYELMSDGKILDRETVDRDKEISINL